MIFLLTGTMISWCQVMNNKMFSDIVPAESYSYVFALDRVVEGVLCCFFAYHQHDCALESWQTKRKKPGQEQPWRRHPGSTGTANCGLAHGRLEFKEAGLEVARAQRGSLMWFGNKTSARG